MVRACLVDMARACCRARPLGMPFHRPPLPRPVRCGYRRASGLRMSSRPLFIGIDLGTTNSTAAAFDGDAVTLVRSASGAPLTPSVVRIDERGKVTVGHRARRMLETDPANTRSEFKR